MGLGHDSKDENNRFNRRESVEHMGGKIAASLDPWPPPLQPIVKAQRRGPLAFIGIGFSGYAVLKALCDRANEAQFDLVANDVALIHIELGERSEPPRNYYVSSLANDALISCYIEGAEATYTDLHEDPRFGMESWGWLFQFGLNQLTDRYHRHTGRAILHDHFQVERTNSPLYAKFSTTLARDTEIVLVGSTLELHGANLFPDVAVIAKHFSPNGSVTSLTLMDELSDHNFAMLDGDRKLHIAACYLELSYYSAENAVAPVISGFPYKVPGRLLDAVYFLSSEDDRLIDKPLALLWTLCLSGDLSTTLRRLAVPNITQDNVSLEEMVFNRMFVHEIRAPFQERRQLIREIIKKEVIITERFEASTNQNRGRRSSIQGEALNAILREAHQDLLTPIRLLIDNIYPVTSKLEDLERWLVKERQSTQRKINDARDTYKRAITPPFDIVWKEVDLLPPRLLSIGWEWEHDGTLLMRFGVDGPESFVDDLPFSKYTEKIDEFANRMSLSLITDDLSRLKNRLIENNQLHIDWNERFRRWTNLMSQELVRGTILTRESLVFGLPSWDDQITMLKGDDPTGAVQIMLSSRLSVSNSLILNEADSVLLREKVIHQPLARALHIFLPLLTTQRERRAFLSLPALFFTFVNDETLFRAFFWAWYNGQLPKLFETPDLLQNHHNMRSYDDLSWMERVSKFQQGWYISDNIRSRLEIASLQPLENDHFLDTSDVDYVVFDEHLIWLFEKITEIVEVDLPINNPELERLLRSRRGIFEFFLCWAGGAFEGRQKLILRGKTWLERIENFIQSTLSMHATRVAEIQQYNPGVYPELLQGSDVIDDLNRIFAVWQEKIDETPHLPILWRWN